MKKADTLYELPMDKVSAFQFDDKVADVFADMINRSVPGYATLVSAIAMLAGRYAQAYSHCYDLGCALGAVAFAMRHTILKDGCDIIAIDNSPAMITKATKRLAAKSPNNPTLRFKCTDIQNSVIVDASVVVMNFTLQFIPLNERLPLIKRIYNGIRPGGVLILAEKIAFDQEDAQAFHTDSHYLFKRINGYSELEISQKRLALENVLIAEASTCHRQRLFQAGFAFVDRWFQCFNFVAYIAVK